MTLQADLELALQLQLADAPWLERPTNPRVWAKECSVGAGVLSLCAGLPDCQLPARRRGSRLLGASDQPEAVPLGAHLPDSLQVPPARLAGGHGGLYPCSHVAIDAKTAGLAWQPTRDWANHDPTWHATAAMQFPMSMSGAAAWVMQAE